MPAVIFDLDDTLYPERSYVLSGFRAVAGWCHERFGVPVAEGFAELRHLSEHGATGRVFDSWLELHGLLDPDTVCEMVQVYREHRPDISLYPGIKELLLRTKKWCRVGLLSDGYLEVQRKKLDALAIEPLFDAVVFSDELGRDAWKPSIAPFEMILERLGVRGADAVYVGDNPAKDFIGARRAGLKTVQLAIPYGVYAGRLPPTPEHSADETISSLERLESTLRRLWKEWSDDAR